MAAGAQNTDGARHAEEEEETDGRRDATVGRPLSVEEKFLWIINTAREDLKNILLVKKPCLEDCNSMKQHV